MEAITIDFKKKDFTTKPRRARSQEANTADLSSSFFVCFGSSWFHFLECYISSDLFTQSGDPASG